MLCSPGALSPPQSDIIVHRTSRVDIPTLIQCAISIKTFTWAWLIEFKITFSWALKLFVDLMCEDDYKAELLSLASSVDYSMRSGRTRWCIS